MKYNFSKVSIKTLDGQEVKELHKILANAIYVSTKDLGLVKVAQDIYDGKEVEIWQAQAEEIKRVIQDEKTGFFAFVQAGLLEYIDKA